MLDVIRSHPGVCDVELLRGAKADPARAPALLFEVAHGATRASDFADLRAALRGPFARDLQDFFFVNTDVGAPELARAVAARCTAALPSLSALVVRCRIPRTFVDCNRRIEETTVPSASRADDPTPGLPPWITDLEDKRLLLHRYATYRQIVAAAFAAVCGNGGYGLCVHSYAPRSIEVPIDADIVAHLRAAYAPGRLEQWPLRSPVDLITHDPDGRELAAAALAARAAAEFAAAGFAVARNQAYSLHPVTLAHEFATRYHDRTLCLEVRRDLLVGDFTPFVELIPADDRVDRAAAPLANALLAALA